MVILDHAAYVNIETKNNDFDPNTIIDSEYSVRKANKKAKKDLKKSAKYNKKHNNLPPETSKSNLKLEARTPKQKEYLTWLNDFNTHILFGIGPAGSGKTYMAAKWAALAFMQDVYDKIIIIRPMVTAGENIGFLPGTVTEKLSPILASILDPLEDTFGRAKLESLINLNKIEIAPLGFLRGRTFSKAVVIFDEAQNASAHNTTTNQIKMFLSRIGEGSKLLVTGDIEQSDIGSKNGLIDFMNRFDKSGGIEGIQIVKFGEEDIVRHHLIKDILKLYEDPKP